MSNLRDKIAKLANEKPELRKHLMPILKQAGDDDELLVFDLYRGIPSVGKELWNQMRENDLDDRLIQFSRKPGDWGEVRKKVRVNALPPEFQKAIKNKKIPTAVIPTAVELWAVEFSNTLKNALLVLLVHNRKLYLVNTEGYNYPRYMVQLT